MNQANVTGSLYMVLAMAAFAIEDMFVKAAANVMPLGVILSVFGIGGSIIFTALLWHQGDKVLHPAFRNRSILLRASFEVLGRLCFALAITLTTLSSASAILQASPLVVVLGAAIFFNEKVGLKRWLCILLGFVGMLLILRPNVDGFDHLSLLAVVATLGFAGRDLATRAAPKELSNLHLGVYGFLVLIPTGIVLTLYNNAPITFNSDASLALLGAILFGVIAYYSLTVAMRSGAISVVSPFRYTRLLFALCIGVFIFNEQPDFTTLIGSALIVGSGLYSLSLR